MDSRPHPPLAWSRRANAAPWARAGRCARWLLAAALGLGINAELAAQQLSFRPYTQSDGLTNLAVNFLEQGPDGSLWIGTDGALFRFDGTAFTQYDKRNGLPAEAVRGMAEDRHGRLWVLLDRGLYVGDAKGFKPVRTSAGPVLADHAPAITPTRDGRLLVINDKRAVQITPPAGPGEHLWRATPFFTDAQIRSHPALGTVSRLFQSTDDALWMGCGDRICSLKDGAVETFAEAEGVPSGSYTNFLQDHAHTLWARSAAHLLERRENGPFVTNDPPHAELDSRTGRPLLTLDPDGRLLVRTASGLARWDGDHWIELTAANGLPDTFISAALVDNEGSLWLAPSGFGIWRWQGYDNVESWTHKQGLASDKIWSIVRDHEGQLLLGTERRCQMLDTVQSRIVDCPFADLPRKEVSAFAMDAGGGTWWGLDSGELWHVAPGENRAVQVPFAAPRVSFSSIRFDRAGTGWITCFEDGLYRLDAGSEVPQPVVLPAAKVNVYDTADDSVGGIWVAASGGVFHLQRGRWQFVPVRDEDGSPAVVASVVATPDGYVWAAGFGKGVWRLDGHDPRRQKWMLPGEIATATLYSLQTDRRGWLWANTDQGVAVFDGNIWRRLDVNDGLIWNDTQQDAFLAEADGSVWIGTSNGLTHIKHPDALIHANSSLDLRIAGAYLGTRSLLAETHPSIAWSSNDAFDLQLSSNSFSRSPSTEFRYRLVGLSSEWFGSSSPRVHVPALAPGRYTLEAVAVDGTHGRRSKLVTLEFRVLPPWWDTIVFRLGVLLAAVALIAWALRWQMERQQAKERAQEAEHRERQVLVERATRDALTGLWNRGTIFDALRREVEESHRTACSLAVALIDVDHFKRINDTFGHPGGDEVLQQLARRLLGGLRQSDWLGRYGGEELLMVLPGLTRQETTVLLERLRESVSDQPFSVQDTMTCITVSVGVAWRESVSDTAETLIACADTALYEAKKSGRNRVVASSRLKPAGAPLSTAKRYLPELLDRLTRAQQRAAGGRSD